MSMRTLIAVCVGLMIGNQVFAQTTPADFLDGERSLNMLIEFPELRGDASVTISCFGLLDGGGKMGEHGCYQRNPGDDVFVRNIYDIIKKARFTPAMHDGRQVTVVFQYRIQFVKKGEEQIIRMVANPGYEENVDAYGSEHIAAQRVYGKEGWEKSCPKQAGFVVLAKANVDYEGTPSSASITQAGGIPITQRCEQALIDNLLNSRFIPAMVDGETVTSTFVEPFGN